VGQKKAGKALCFYSTDGLPSHNIKIMMREGGDRFSHLVKEKFRGLKNRKEGGIGGNVIEDGGLFDRGTEVLG